MHRHTSHCTRGLGPEERLDHYVLDRPDDGCWLWSGTANYAGYGVTNFGKTQVRAHRMAYEVWVGPIPDGQTIDHVYDRGCRSRLCCNPAHLEPVPTAVNSSRERTVRGRRDRCIHDHPFDIERRVGDKVYRDCRTCRRERGRRADRKRRGAVGTK